MRCCFEQVFFGASAATAYSNDVDAPQTPTGQVVGQVVGRRVRQAFQADALFEVVCGSVLMANPLVGPDLGVNGYLVGLVGLLLMVVAVLLGGAGLGKGPLADNIGPLSIVNGVSGVLLLIWALVVDHEGAARTLLILVGGGLVGLAAFQRAAIRQPDIARRVVATQAELHAALRGERPQP